MKKLFSLHERIFLIPLIEMEEFLFLRNIFNFFFTKDEKKCIILRRFDILDENGMKISSNFSPITNQRIYLDFSLLD
jgi:hypothetical protein